MSLWTDENDRYRVAVREGILMGRRNQFDLCTQQLHSTEDMSRDGDVALQSESGCGGQGYAKCNCAASGKQMSDKPM